MKVLVLGASGYLGGRISSYLAERGHQVVAQVRRLPQDCSHFKNQMAEVVVGDLTDQAFVQSLSDLRSDAAVYTVSLNHHRSGEDIHETLAVNVAATWSVLDALARTVTSRFVYLSTQQVYGRSCRGTVTESTPPRPVNAYGLTHLMSEEISNCFGAKSQMSCVNVRPSNGYGMPLFAANDCWWLALNAFCLDAVKKGKIQLQSDGSAQRDFIDVSDLCRAIEHLLRLDAEVLTLPSYNLGSGTAVTILEAAHRVAECYEELFGAHVPVLFPGGVVSDDPGIHANGENFTYTVDALRQTGFETAKDLKTGIREMLWALGDLKPRAHARPEAGD